LTRARRIVVVRTNPKAGTGNPTFMVVPDGDPDKETGLKSVDWWGPWRCDPAYSAAGWDRWVFRRLYCTGSEGGIGWDMTCQAGVEFSATVEDWRRARTIRRGLRDGTRWPSWRAGPVPALVFHVPGCLGRCRRCVCPGAQQDDARNTGRGV